MDEIKYLNDINSCISTYSLPSSEAKPFRCLYDYNVSSYAVNDYWCSTINQWDVEDNSNYFAKELFTFDFKVKTLCSAYQHKYNDLFLFKHNSDIRNLVPGIDMSKVDIKSRHDFPSDVVVNLKRDDTPRLRIHGQEGFREELL